MVDSDGRVVIVNMASLSDQDSDGVVEVSATNTKRKNSSKTNGNLSNSESR